MRGDVYDGRGFIKSAMAGPTDPTDKAQAARHRSRRQARHGGRSNVEALRGVELADVAPQRPHAQLRLNAKLGRDTPLIGDLRAAPRRPAGDLSRNERCRRAVALHRHVFAHGRREDVGRDGSADRRTARRRKASSMSRDFSIRGEHDAGARRVERARWPPAPTTSSSAQARAEFTRAPGRSRCATAWCGAR